MKPSIAKTNRAIGVSNFEEGRCEFYIWTPRIEKVELMGFESLTSCRAEQALVFYLYSSTMSQPLARSNALAQPRRNAWRSVASIHGMNRWPISRSASIS